MARKSSLSRGILKNRTLIAGIEGRAEPERVLGRAGGRKNFTLVANYEFEGDASSQSIVVGVESLDKIIITRLTSFGAVGVGAVIAA